MRERTGNRNIELLAPAGSYETFQAVLAAGADAVYLGGTQFGARAYADNFTEQQILLAIDEAHIHGREVYLTVNTLLKEDELERKLYNYLLPYYKQGLDAVILQDMGAFSLVRREFPGLSIHTSTQMTIMSRYGAEYMRQLGASRIVTAREMSFDEIQKIHEHVEVEIESFVHGALCYCYSGQCLFSSLLGGRSGNRGRCAQPCRLPYEVYDGELASIAKGRNGAAAYILSPKDLCTIEAIPRMAESGIYSLKIEGRMKQAEYAAGVVSLYRRCLDRYLAKLQTCRKKAGSEAQALEWARQAYYVTPEEMRMLSDLGNRSGFTSGYYYRQNGKDMITFDKPNHAKSNDKLQQEVREKYIKAELKEKINGNLRLYKEFPAKMKLSFANMTVETEGGLVQAALNQPLSREKVIACLEKTGNTPFEFGDLRIEMEEDVFLPVQSINQLRRDALDALASKLTEKYRRKPDRDTVCGEADEEWNITDGNTKVHLAVSAEQRFQIAEVILYPYIADIYLDSSLYTRTDLLEKLSADVKAIHAKGKKAYYIFPAVFRDHTAAFYLEIVNALKLLELDGFVAKNLDAAAFIRENFAADTPLILDHSLYTYNNRARHLLWKFDPIRDTAPLELNRKELSGRDNRGSELVVYGNLPLMTSAQCVHANMGKCDEKPQLTWLKDRYGKYFPVKNNCMECYNTIYNSMPLVLFEFGEEFEKMGIKNLRISFTTENAKEVREVMALYEAVFLQGMAKVKEVCRKEYTNGHYKRGVE